MVNHGQSGIGIIKLQGKHSQMIVGG